MFKFYSSQQDDSRASRLISRKTIVMEVLIVVFHHRVSLAVISS